MQILDTQSLKRIEHKRTFLFSGFSKEKYIKKLFSPPSIVQMKQESIAAELLKCLVMMPVHVTLE